MCTSGWTPMSCVHLCNQHQSRNKANVSDPREVSLMAPGFPAASFFIPVSVVSGNRIIQYVFFSVFCCV